MERPQNTATLPLAQQTFLKATLQKDTEFLTKAVHDQFIFISPKAVLLNKITFLNDFVNNQDIVLDVFESEEQNIVIVDDVGVSNGVLAAKFKGKDLLKIRFSMTFIFTASNWQLLSMQETYMA